MITDYHARYFAHELTRRRAADGIGRLSQSLFDACVDLNPHQIEAAMFALRSPLDSGVILADEVGLGKTIEAGVLLCQHWAERRRNLIVVCPASLRRQWAAELEEKFNLPALVLDSRTLAEADGNPLGAGRAVVVMSYNFAARLAETLYAVPWDLAVIDEAHKLRNVHKPGNVTGQRIKRAFAGRRKVLLTATPLQNSLMELYGLASLLDDYIFGDQAAFRAQFAGPGANLDVLRGRLRAFCHRTLRAEVQEYVRYTERRPITIPFTPSDPEQALYEKVSAFLLRGASFAIPQRQRQLTVLVLRKLLASSSHAIAGTLETVVRRLEAMRDGTALPDALIETLAEAEDLDGDYLDEPVEDDPADNLLSNDRGRLEQEIAELAAYAALARGIGVDTKARALLTALDKGFAEMARTGAARKALVFTESRRTQDYLKVFLEANGFAGKVVAFNGSNGGPDARAILDGWLAGNRDTGRATGSRAVDMRTALVEHFRDRAEIMLATEAAAEGVNLQFCSLVVNYDLPWNPQRVEQRIGRCHRYGQKHDVVVVNFLNQRNAADRRVLELLDEKFQLFKGIFGASDEVLGAVESGIDFEKRILAIHQECRTEAEIDAAFAALQAEMDEAIRTRMADARRLLFAHFDEDVHARLKLRLGDARHQLDRTGRMFWRLSRHVLDGRAAFEDEQLAFRLTDPPLSAAPAGRYHLISKERENAFGSFLYRLGHPLGEWALERARDLPTPMGKVAFDITSHPARITVVERLRGSWGWLSLHLVTLESFEREEFLVLSGIDRQQKPLDPEVLDKLFACDGVWQGNAAPPHELIRTVLEEKTRGAIGHTLAVAEARNARFLEEQRVRLERWADDKLFAAEKELNDIKARLKDLARQARQTADSVTADPAGQLAIQRQIQDAEKAKRRARQRIFDAEDEILGERDRLIEALGQRLNRRTNIQELFTIQWEVV